MIVLAVDPGSKMTGWCLYDSFAKRAVEAGEVEASFDLDLCMEMLRPAILAGCTRYVIEKPVGQGPTRPEMVATGVMAGWYFATINQLAHKPVFITRQEVKRALSLATHNEIRVINDATAWAALVNIHGEGSDCKARVKKGVEIAPAGAIGICRGHAKAALAVAVAFAAS